MNTILDILGELMLFGSIALLIWGGMLTLGQLFQSERKGKARQAVAPHGQGAHGAHGAHGTHGTHHDAWHAGLAAVVVAVALAAASPDARAEAGVVRGGERDLARAMEAIDTYDYAGALEPLRSVAQLGNLRAQEVLGFMLVYGQRVYRPAVTQDVREGVAWLRRAEAQGSEVAPYILGGLDRRTAALAAID